MSLVGAPIGRRRPVLRRVTATLLAALLLGGCASAAGRPRSTPRAPLAGIPAGGTMAANFSLQDQFGHRQRLSDFLGQVILLTFIDNRCTTLCPLAASLMREAKDLVGADPPVQLIAINSNPKYTSVEAVRRWSDRRRMTHRWLFLTAPAPTLRAVWASYGIRAQMVNGDVEHTSAVFVIDPSGRIRTVFPISSRKGIQAEAEVLAQTARRVAEAA